MKKIIVIGVIALFVGVSIIPSINANVSRLPVKSKLVETTVRIHRANRVTPYTLKLTEKESDEVDRIFDNIKVSLDSAETGEEIDEIYDDAVESLYMLGLFPRMSVEEAKQLVNGEGVKSPSENLIGVEKNFDCQIVGKTTHTYMWDLDKPFWNIWLKFRRYFPFGPTSRWNAVNLRRYTDKIGHISFGEFDDGDYWVNWYPSEGWVWTNGTNGVKTWNGIFHGVLGSRWVWTNGHFGDDVTVYMGVVNFEGLWIGGLIGPAYIIGNAENARMKDGPYHHEAYKQG